jgi:hypothetical protein
VNVDHLEWCDFEHIAHQTVTGLDFAASATILIELNSDADLMRDLAKLLTPRGKLEAVRTARAVGLLEEQRQKFIQRYGREPGPGDKVFFDMPHPEQVEHMTVQAMETAGIDPAIIYAYEKTGRLVTEDNQNLLSEADLDEWQAAIEEYEMKRRKRTKPPDYPIGTVAMYGPDDKTTTKIAAGVIVYDGAKAIIKRWVATDVTTNAKVRQEMKDFFLQHGVNSVAVSEGNMGCPHEEGEDFPHGEDCLFCPFWKGKQGSRAK